MGAQYFEGYEAAYLLQSRPNRNEKRIQQLDLENNFQNAYSNQGHQLKIIPGTEDLRMPTLEPDKRQDHLDPSSSSCTSAFPLILTQLGAVGKGRCCHTL